jgi:uncharacterized protein YndB with AHSA1/START domain
MRRSARHSSHILNYMVKYMGRVKVLGRGMMMPDIVKELIIAATPKRVWSALTQPDELAHWSTGEIAHRRPEVGILAQFRFRQGLVSFTLRSANWRPETVSWMTGQSPPSLGGTRVIWRLTQVQAGTKVILSHEGFTQADEAYEDTKRDWDDFLDSLKSYLETGKGTPGFPRFV